MLSSLNQLTLPQILEKQSQTSGNEKIAIRDKAYGIWHTYSWIEYFDYARRTGLGLCALGLKRGEHIGIITNNIPEWLFSEIGGQAVGGITYNLFTSAMSNELCSMLTRANVSYVIAQDQEQVDKLIDNRSKLTRVRRVIYIDPTGMRSYVDDPWLISFADMLKLGDALNEQKPDFFSNQIKRGRKDDVAVIVQTSGTTGVYKLVMLSHSNITEMAVRWTEALSIKPEEKWLSMTQPAWIVDKIWGIGVALLSGMTMNFPETPDTAYEDFREIGPTVIIATSRFWQEIASNIMIKAYDSAWIKRSLFNYALNIGEKCLELKSRKERIPLFLQILSFCAYVVIYRPLLDRIGCSRLKNAFTGDQPISPDVIRFFGAIGLNLKQCYGLTEAGGIFQIQPDDGLNPITVGKPLPRTGVKISLDNEVLVKSEANFIGYYNDFKSTEEAFSDGWLKTGDAGHIDKDGHLHITGRLSDIFQKKDGQVFSPDFVEARLKFSPYIKEAVVYGEGRPYITALINIDMRNVGSWAGKRKLAYTTYMDLSQQPDVEELIGEELKKINGQVPEFMMVRKFILLYKLLDADDDELTRTGKIRRRFIYGLYIKLIEAMYGNIDEIRVKGKIQYRDGHIGEIETKVRILTVN